EGVCRHGPANHFPVNGSASLYCVLIFLQDDGAGAFTHYKAVALRIKGAGGCGRVFITRAQCFERVKPGNAGAGNGRFGATGHNYIGLAQAYVVESVYQGAAGRSAGRYRTEVDAHETIFNGDLPGSNIRYQLGNKEGIELWYEVPCCKFHDLVLEGLHTAVARSPYHAYPGLVYPFQVDTGVFNGLLGGYHCILGKEVHFAGLFFLHELFYIKTLQLAGELGFELRSVKTGNRPRTAGASLHILPKSVYIIPDRC